jgi:hypothetical protein
VKFAVRVLSAIFASFLLLDNERICLASAFQCRSKNNSSPFNSISTGRANDHLLLFYHSFFSTQNNDYLYETDAGIVYFVCRPQEEYLKLKSVQSRQEGFIAMSVRHIQVIDRVRNHFYNLR